MARNKRGGRKGIQKAIADAETVPPRAVVAETPRSADPTPELMPSVKIGGGVLEMRAEGLYRVPAEGAPTRIAGPFEVLSQTRDDEATAWGLLVRFRDPDGAVQLAVVTRDLFAGEGGELRNTLARRGLYVNPAQSVRGVLADYLSRIGTDKRARIVGRTGWHRIDGVQVFVLPGRTFGKPPVEVIYQPPVREVALFGQLGTLADWRETVAARCVGNSRLVLAVAAAFAGPLLGVVGEDGGGLHFRGAARVGKTTALRVAASVWGGEAGKGATAYVRQWRATGNAIEGIAAAQSDTLLALDELGQADPREVGDTCYLLASGLGKARSDRVGSLRAPARFTVLFLSTGELSLADKIAEAGRRVRAGQEVRLVDIPAEAGAGLGMFEDLHDAADAEIFIRGLNAAIGKNYGTAAAAFLAHLVALVSIEPGLGDRLRDWTASLVKDWLEECPEAGGQVASVARRFAMIAVAGELATQAEITGWDPTEAANAAHRCFRAWLTERGTAGAREDADAVAQLRNFISRHGSARFDEWDEAAAQGKLDLPTPPVERFRTVNRAGWRRRDGDETRAWHYYFTADGMAEALAGLDRRQAHRVLIDRGFLLTGSDGKTAGTHRPPGHGTMRLYHVLPAILMATEGDV